MKLVNKKNVILLHGLGTNFLVMKYIEKHLKESKFNVFQFDYKSTQYSYETLKQLHQLIQTIEGDVYLIGHSMGGLVSRNYIHHFDLMQETQKVKGVITIATPHNKSICANNILSHPIKFFGKLLGTSIDSGLTIDIPKWSAHIPLGCIAGVLKSKISANLFVMSDFHLGENDGTVFVHEAILDNAHDSIRIPGSHTGLLFKKDVARQCIYFLEHFKFNV